MGYREAVFADDIINMAFWAVKDIPLEERRVDVISRMIRFGCRFGLKGDEKFVTFRFAHDAHASEKKIEKFSGWDKLRLRIRQHLAIVHKIDDADIEVDVHDRRDDDAEVAAGDIGYIVAKLNAVIGDKSNRFRLKSTIQSFLSDNPAADKFDDIKGTHVAAMRLAAAAKKFATTKEFVFEDSVAADVACNLVIDKCLKVVASAIPTGMYDLTFLVFQLYVTATEDLTICRN